MEFLLRFRLIELLILNFIDIVCETNVTHRQNLNLTVYKFERVNKIMTFFYSKKTRTT